MAKLTPLQNEVLETIVFCELNKLPLTQSSLARSLRHPKATIRNAIHSIQKKGFLSKSHPILKWQSQKVTK